MPRPAATRTARELDGIELIETSQLDRLAAEFDVVHAHIVFQHIPPKLGYALFERVASLLRPGGVGVLHVTLSAPNRSARLPVFILGSQVLATRGRPSQFAPQVRIELPNNGAQSLRP